MMRGGARLPWVRLGYCVAVGIRVSLLCCRCVAGACGVAGAQTSQHDRRICRTRLQRLLACCFLSFMAQLLAKTGVHCALAALCRPPLPRCCSLLSLLLLACSCLAGLLAS